MIKCPHCHKDVPEPLDEIIEANSDALAELMEQVKSGEAALEEMVKEMQSDSEKLLAEMQTDDTAALEQLYANLQAAELDAEYRRLKAALRAVNRQRNQLKQHRAKNEPNAEQIPQRKRALPYHRAAV